MEGAQRSHRSQTGHLRCHPGREIEIGRYAMLERITKFALDRPKIVISLAVVLTGLFGLQFSRITIDTDHLATIRGTVVRAGVSDIAVNFEVNEPQQQLLIAEIMSCMTIPEPE